MSSDKTRLLSYTFVTHALVHGLVLSLPLFIPIWLVEFSATRADLGFAMAALFVFYGGTAIPAGVLSDRYGADQFITLFLLGTGIALVAMLVVDRFFLLGVILAGIGFTAGLYHAPILSLLSRQPYSSSRIFAYHNLGAHLGIGFGPLIVAVLLAFYDWRTVLLGTAMPFLLMGVLFHFTGPSDTANRNRSDGDYDGLSIQTRKLLVAGFLFVWALYMLRGVYHRGALTFLPDFLNLMSELPSIMILEKEISPGRWIYSLILLAGAGGEIVGGFLGERIDPRMMLAAMFLVSAAILGVMGNVTGWALFLLAGGLGFLLYTFPPILQNLVAEFSAESSRGLGYGFTSAGNIAVGGFIGSSIAGVLITGNSYAVAFKVLAIFPLVGVVIVIGFVRWTDTRETSTSQ